MLSHYWNLLNYMDCKKNHTHWGRLYRPLQLQRKMQWKKDAGVKRHDTLMSLTDHTFVCSYLYWNGITWFNNIPMLMATSAAMPIHSGFLGSTDRRSTVCAPNQYIKCMAVLIMTSCSLYTLKDAITVQTAVSCTDLGYWEQLSCMIFRDWSLVSWWMIIL